MTPSPHIPEPQEHPPPTDATVKMLYWLYRACAHPDCDEPLYRSEADVPERVLNSTVAHIHARRSNGPRWKSGMTTEENRDHNNLLLLCRYHSALIDRHEAAYPPEKLRMWKAAAEEEGSGSTISDAEVREVVAVSIHQEISLEFYISLGGTMAGGGGAFGLGARGGDGGTIIVTDLVPPASLDVPDSGATVGRAHIEGVDGQPGGPTALYLNGELVAAAGGGGGGPAGNANRATSDQFALSALVLAAAVPQSEGLVDLKGGAWVTWTGVLPEVVTWTPFFVVEAGNVPVGTYTIHVAVQRPDGTQVTKVSLPLTVVEAGDILRHTIHVGLHGELTTPGVYRIAVSTDIAELGHIDVLVIQAGPPGAAPSSGHQTASGD